MAISPTFYNDVEKSHNHVVYSDTDSLYINIPTIKPKTIEESIKFGNKFSTEINNSINNYMVNDLLPKLNIDPIHNHTFFKTEIIASALMMLDVKKNYAYKMIAKEGVILSKPKVKYVGIPIVRNDYSKFTQEMLIYLIEEICLNENVIDKISEIIKYVKIMNNKMKDNIIQLNYQYIGIPTKWTGRTYVKDTAALIGMKLFNTINNIEYFKPLTSGKRLLIKINNHKIFTSEISEFIGKNKNYLAELDISKLSNICIPSAMPIDKLALLFNKFSISIDENITWDTLFSTTCKRIVEIIKDISK